MTRIVMRSLVVGLASAGVVGTVVVGLLVVLMLLAAVGFRRPWALLRLKLQGIELWLAFLVAAIATSGSLFFSEIAHFTPCALCWYQRLCMYPLAIATFVIAASGAVRTARWLLPLSLVGSALSVYHILIENGLAPQTAACLLSVPGGCALKWINEFGYIPIPTLALTAFVLVSALLLLATPKRRDDISLSAKFETGRQAAAQYGPALKGHARFTSLLRQVTTTEFHSGRKEREK